MPRPPLDKTQWYRTCQECGHQQNTPQPADPSNLPSSYTEAKCRRCHSPGLDFGTYQVPSTGEDDQD